MSDLGGKLLKHQSQTNFFFKKNSLLLPRRSSHFFPPPRNTNLNDLGWDLTSFTLLNTSKTVAINFSFIRDKSPSHVMYTEASIYFEC